MEIVIPDFMVEFWKTANPGVVKYPDPVLRRPTVPVRRISPGVQALIDRMMRIMKNANGLGLAAPQVGVSERVIILAPLEESPIAVINPEIVSTGGGQVMGQEGCLSIPRLYGDVMRYVDVELKGLNRKGKPIHLKLTGMGARIAQHEVDHLDGVLFTDKVDAKTLHWSMPGSDDDEDQAE